MPLHRIISQWSGLFLLSHALSFFFFFSPSLQNESWIQPSLPGGERRAGGLADQSWASEADTQTEGAFCCSALIAVQDNFPFGPKKIKRWRVREQISSASSVFFLLVMVNAQSQLIKVTVVLVCGSVTAPTMMSSGTTTGLLFPAWPAPCQPPDSSRLAFSPLFPGPLLLFPLTFHFSSPRGPTENTAQIRASEPQSQP